MKMRTYQVTWEDGTVRTFEAESTYEARVVMWYASNLKKQGSYVECLDPGWKRTQR